jgi:DNA-binding CsgD family transcriptional regulator
VSVHVQPGDGRRRAARLTDRVTERAALDRLVEDVRAGQSRALVVRGDPGVGKTVLLEYLAGQASQARCRVARAVGVQSEMELAFAGLHQLCAPLLDRAERLPPPQRDALRTALGLSDGPPPDGFMVGLAVLSLLAGVAGERPLICLVDDAQWLDRASAQVLGFTARRVAADPVGLVFAAREPGAELAALTELEVGGLQDDDARALLDSALSGPLDERVRDLIVAETGGNPLALLELPRGLSPAELAGGFGLPGARPGTAPLTGRIEDSFLRQLDALPAPTRRLLLLAAADPSGDPSLVWRAAARLDLPVEAAEPAAEAGLAEFGTRVRLRHPLVRSAAYRSASHADRQAVHAALAEETDPVADPDRRAWHRAQAAPGPDEQIAAELERSAERARARGGVAAAAAFRERAALLTPAPAHRARRLLAAGRAKRDAGALEAAAELLAAANAGPLNATGTADAERLRGQIALDQQRGTDAARLLLRAARLFEPVDTRLARETHLESLVAAVWIGPDGLREAAVAALAAPPGPQPPRAVDVLLDALALWFAGEHDERSGSQVSQAMELLLALDVSNDPADRWLWLTAGIAIDVTCLELWDIESMYALATAQVRFARETGALVQLQFALGALLPAQVIMGELTAAAQLIEETYLIAEATGNPPFISGVDMIETWRGREREASELIEAASQAGAARGSDVLVNWAAYLRSVLNNGLGRYDAARDAARRAFERKAVGHGSLVASELAEAAARTGDVELVRVALEWVSERARVTPTDWALGIEARIRALLSDGDMADSAYQESISHLSRTRMRPELARSHLLYGEWLRRENRRVDARDQLRTAYQLLDAMGMGAFADRARRELLATGETVHKRSTETDTTLTVQEAIIARLARDGRTNPEIGAHLFLSARTVQYHLGKVFTKLGITSRSQLHRALPSDPDLVPRARADRASDGGEVR